MTIYACSSVAGFVPPGGVCEGHSIDDEPADPDYPGLSIDCPVCEPLLIGDPFWAGDPETVPLTRSEERRLEREKRQLEVDALANARADQEYLRQKRLEDQRAKDAEDKSEDKSKPASRTRSKARGASA